jgi:hypothetical protein
MPGGYLGTGTFWMDFVLFKDPKLDVNHCVEVYQLPTKLLLKVQKDEHIAFENTFFEVPIKLSAEWQI